MDTFSQNRIVYSYVERHVYKKQQTPQRHKPYDKRVNFLSLNNNNTV